MVLVTVSVGTDHHPFDRLIDWFDSIAIKDLGYDVIIQRGTSKSSNAWESMELIPFKDLCELFSKSTAVVCHGGPSTVMDVRKAGKLPIVLPRNPEFGEHVDDHQMKFADHLDQNGIAKVIKTQDELFQELSYAFENPEAYEVSNTSGALPGVVKFGQVVDSLLGVNTNIVSSSESVEFPDY